MTSHFNETEKRTVYTDKFLELRGYFFGSKIEICTLLKDFKLLDCESFT